MCNTERCMRGLTVMKRGLTAIMRGAVSLAAMAKSLARFWELSAQEGIMDSAHTPLLPLLRKGGGVGGVDAFSVVHVCVMLCMIFMSAWCSYLCAAQICVVLMAPWCFWLHFFLFCLYDINVFMVLMSGWCSCLHGDQVCLHSCLHGAHVCGVLMSVWGHVCLHLLGDDVSVVFMAVWRSCLNGGHVRVVLMPACFYCQRCAQICEVLMSAQCLYL
jgi:hypothetical protein